MRRYRRSAAIAGSLLSRWSSQCCFWQSFSAATRTSPPTRLRKTTAAESSSGPTPQPPVSSDNKAPANAGITHGRVLQEVSPDVSPGARRTITGHIKVSARVSVDNSGNISEVTLVSSGPSKYFAKQALAAARRWKFSPAQVNGQPSASEWILRFQFGRTSTQVSPTETKP